MVQEMLTTTSKRCTTLNENNPNTAAEQQFTIQAMFGDQVQKS